MASQNKEAENKSVGKIAHYNNSKLLELAPISILKSNLVKGLKLIFQFNHRSVDQLQEYILTQIMNAHSEPKHTHEYDSRLNIFEYCALAYAHVINHLLKDELKFAYCRFSHNQIVLYIIIITSCTVDVLVKIDKCIIFKLLVSFKISESAIV